MLPVRSHATPQSSRRLERQPDHDTFSGAPAAPGRATRDRQSHVEHKRALAGVRLAKANGHCAALEEPVDDCLRCLNRRIVIGPGKRHAHLIGVVVLPARVVSIEARLVLHEPEFRSPACGVVACRAHAGGNPGAAPASMFAARPTSEEALRPLRGKVTSGDVPAWLPPPLSYGSCVKAHPTG